MKSLRKEKFKRSKCERLIDMRFEQHDTIRTFIEVLKKTKVFPENVDNEKCNLEISGLSLKDNENCYSSRTIVSEKEVGQTLVQLESLTMNGLYILDEDILGMLLQIKIYIMNLNMFSIILQDLLGHSIGVMVCERSNFKIIRGKCKYDRMQSRI